MNMITKMMLPLLLLLSAGLAQAAVPSLSPAPDQRAQQGMRYVWLPTLAGGGPVTWSKAYGPDDVVVNPATGEVIWEIPADLPSESFHIGVRASNLDGAAVDTWIVTVGDGQVIYVGPLEHQKTLASGMAAMAPGDTLVLRDGTWISENKENTIPGSSKKVQQPPSGTASAFTTVMGENPRDVFIDGENFTDRLIYLNGTYEPLDFAFNGSAAVPRNYIAIKGLILKNARTSSLRADYVHDVKFIDIGVGDKGGSGAGVYIFRSERVLLEGIYAWGRGRYRIQFKDTINSIVRRSVGRMDHYTASSPVGGFQAYCSRNIQFQNNVMIDSDHSEFWTGFKNHQSLFGVPATDCVDYPQENVFERNIGLNADTGLMQTDASSQDNPTLFKEMVGWDLELDRYHAGTGGHIQILHGAGPSVSRNITVGRVSANPGINVAGGRGFFYSRKRSSFVLNSIISEVGHTGSEPADQGPLTWSSDELVVLQYNNVYKFQGPITGDGGNEVVTNTISGDPNLKYIVDLPENSPLLTAGENGDRVGAKVLTFVGRSGTMYGDPGYDEETNIPMWPFPNQEHIAAQFRDFSYTGPVRSGAEETLQGERGFAMAEQDMSHYVWGYIGNTVPPFDLEATPGDGMVTLRWATPAIVGRNSLLNYRVYRFDNGSWQLQTVSSGGSLPKAVVTGLVNGQTYRFRVSAIDQGTGESGFSYEVEGTPSEAAMPHAPRLAVF